MKALRSWSGSYKALKTCVLQYSSLLSGIEAAVGVKQSRDLVDWSESLLEQFAAAKGALHDLKAIAIPRPSDQLVITSDGSV